jgi:hypothetical protein
MLSTFREVVVVDFEFTALPGERPGPVCCVAHELKSGRRFRIFQDQFGSAPPYASGRDVLFIAFYASAEAGCYRVLGWPLPERVLDVFAEFRVRTNGLPTPSGSGLLGAMTYFGLDATGATEKKEMQEAIGSDTWQGRFTPEEILNYCEGDVIATGRLLHSMVSKIDLPRALLRGRYMISGASAMEYNGTPIDVDTFAVLQEGWTGIQDDLIAAIDTDYHVYDGRTFKRDWYKRYLISQGIPWPLTENGELDLDQDTFREMARAYPQIAPLRELRSSLSEMRLNDLRVGRDGRNRTILSVFRSTTGRNQPSNTRFIFGPSVWLRGLIKPPPGHAVAYIDWEQQEPGIAAALSGDAAKQAAYNTGNIYLGFAKQIGAVPEDATKKTHPAHHELFKQVCLGINYGMGPETLARRINRPPIFARDLIRAHRERYQTFWRWSDAALDTMSLTGSLHTVYGWYVHLGENTRPTFLRNFPMQANGAEMMRLAACLGSERGVEICAPIHDAFLIIAPFERLEADITKMRVAMAEASRAVLNGFELRTEVSITRYPDRYQDSRGRVMWNKVMALLDQQQRKRRVA